MYITVFEMSITRNNGPTSESNNDFMSVFINAGRADFLYFHVLVKELSILSKTKMNKKKKKKKENKGTGKMINKPILFL